MKTIGERIRGLREAQGLTVFELSMASGVQPFNIWNWESGRRCSPTVDHLVRIAKALGATPNDLLNNHETSPDE